jgi:hypothetical protein
MMRFAILPPVLVILFLSGCGSFFSRDAGNLDPGDFGNATMQNTLAATGQVMPPISNDKYDANGAANGRKFSGKFMAEVNAGYYGSASAPSSTATADAISTGSALQ